jgi:hypothetical protein
MRRAAAQSDARLTKKESRELMMTAKTKADHLRLADYYKAEAERLAEEAKEHQEMALMYKKDPPLIASKHPTEVGEKHCRGIAEGLRKASDQMKALAAMHQSVTASLN